MQVYLSPESRARLNAMRDLLRVDDQSMAVDVLFIRLTGKALG